MSSKEFILGLSERIGISEEITKRIIRYINKCIGNVLESGRGLSLPDIGVFAVEKRMERVVIDPTTQKRMLIPPQNLLKLTDKASDVFDVTDWKDLAGELKRLSRLPDDVAETIIKSFCGYVKMALHNDDNLDIDGLGHFQIMPETHAVIFTPAKEMNERVNRPFSQFVPVILNEGVFFPDIEQDQDTPQPPVVNVDEKDAVEKPEPPVSLEEDTPKEQELEDTPHEDEPPATDGKKKGWSLNKVLASLALLTVLGFGIGYIIGQSSNDDEQETVATESVKEETQQPTATTETKPTVDFDAVNAKTAYGAYKVTAVDTTIVITRTQTIRELAATYFGGEQMEMYIKALNGGKEMAEVGDTLLIPHLEQKR